MPAKGAPKPSDIGDLLAELSKIQLALFDKQRALMAAVEQGAPNVAELRAEMSDLSVLCIAAIERTDVALSMLAVVGAKPSLPKSKRAGRASTGIRLSRLGER